MTEHAPVLVVLGPLFAALLCGLLGIRWPRACPVLAAAGLGVSLGAAAALVAQTAGGGSVGYFVGGWKFPRGIGIELRVDGINAIVAMAVALTGTLAWIFGLGRCHWNPRDKPVQYHILLLLLLAGLFGIVVTGDAFNLYVMIEISALTGYALLGMGRSALARLATFRYLILGTIGASFYLLGVGYLYMATGTLNMAVIRETLAAAPAVPVTLAAFALVMTGLFLKAGLFPLGGWLPDAYGRAPSTSSAVVAPLVTKVTVYVVVRMLIGVFGWRWVFGSWGWNTAIVWLAVASIAAGALMALGARELKRLLCGLIIAEVGYMIGGAWLGNLWGMTGAIYHIVGDAFMTLTLFLTASILAGREGPVPLDRFDRMFRKRPWLMAAFAVGALGMIGLPPTCGFFSKWFLIRGGIEAGHYGYVIALIASSLVNAVVFFRIFEIALFGKTSGAPEPAAEEVIVVRRTDWIALYGAAAMVVLVGLASGWLSGNIQRALEHLMP